MNDNKIERDDTKLIYYIIKKMNLSFMQDDLIDVGYIGYVRALNTYDKEKGQFSTYAYTCIKRAIARHIQLEEGERRRSNVNCISLNNKIDYGSKVELIDFIEDDFDLEKSITNKILIEEILKIAKEILSSREYQIIYMYFIEGYKQIDIAEMLGVSKQNISAVKSNALRKLKRNRKIKKIYETR